jgi:hypothetical protein
MPAMVPGSTLGLMGRPRVGFAALFVALVVTAAACSGGGSSAKSMSAATSNAAANDPAGCRFIVASEATRTIPSSVTLPEYLIGASAAATVCYDKITFVFSQGANPTALPPGYKVTYAKPPFAPKLQSVTESLTGVQAILEVVIAPSSLIDVRSPSNPTHTYQGNLRLALPGLRHTLTVELLSTFPEPPDPNAGSVVWLIGLDSKRPFVTDAAANPPRISVLIMN